MRQIVTKEEVERGERLVLKIHESWPKRYGDAMLFIHPMDYLFIRFHEDYRRGYGDWFLQPDPDSRVFQVICDPAFKEGKPIISRQFPFRIGPLRIIKQPYWGAWKCDDSIRMDWVNRRMLVKCGCGFESEEVPATRAVEIMQLAEWHIGDQIDKFHDRQSYSYRSLT